ncbi:MAG: hydrogenase maturation protease, partial [Campylobacterota bacterium]|nr:hydrogenase maturation protease [Campylobacterota bacterium]
MDTILPIRCLSFGVTDEKFDIMKKTAVIGVGNILFCDDGIGVYVVRYLRENYIFEPPIELVDGGTVGFGLFEYFREYDDVFLLDTLSLEDVAGSIYKIPS